ncbi:SagB/ThcOx family dehydrogenase [Acinetobacter sp. V89_4]|uniref:SagB/ThcOx family dehydrogenase n=1 Tax=Acinetobacter sp. V89_4 TaxID=3044232 RepID=UPI00249F4F32|nr:SagB/ThcOx family dehydrogenase [Acinetobacter sp. V89_4]MDI3454191.1 SagB/ThcOx family dehydrogenase [Acinetobacter sp. V89_4]
MELVVNEDVFFLFINDSYFAWNYKSHKQHKLSLIAINVIADFSLQKNYPSVVEELISVNILISKKTSKTHWKWDVLSKIFHFGTLRYSNSNFEKNAKDLSKGYVEYCNSIIEKIPLDCFDICYGQTKYETLEKNFPEFDLLKKILENRHTNRTFTNKNIPFDKISLILNYTFGYRDHDKREYEKKGLHTPTKRRTSSSGGSLQSCEGYLISMNIDGIEPGVYHFRSNQRNLGKISSIPLEFSFGSLCGGQYFADNLNAAIVITCRFDKLMWKYQHSHSYRVALLDAGHLSQTIQLIASVLDIRTWVTAAFYDDILLNLLQLDEELMEYPLIILGLGTGPKNPFDANLEDIFVNEC